MVQEAFQGGCQLESRGLLHAGLPREKEHPAVRLRDEGPGPTKMLTRCERGHMSAEDSTPFLQEGVLGSARREAGAISEGLQDAMQDLLPSTLPVGHLRRRKS